MRLSRFGRARGLSSLTTRSPRCGSALAELPDLSASQVDKLVADAKGKAKEEAVREAELAREAIATERKAAVAELKAEVAKLSVSIAEQLIRAELADAGKQEALVSKLIDESPLK